MATLSAEAIGTGVVLYDSDGVEWLGTYRGEASGFVLLEEVQRTAEVWEGGAQRVVSRTFRHMFLNRMSLEAWGPAETARPWEAWMGVWPGGWGD